MTLASAINHVAVVTADLDRFVEFYTGVFDVEVVFAEDTPAFRHAMLRTSSGAVLHPAEVDGNAYGTAAPQLFDRGHLDHLALTVPSDDAFAQVRARLVARRASDGAVDDLGAFRSLWFRDPDGMDVEVCVVVDPSLRTVHAPVPMEEPA